MYPECDNCEFYDRGDICDECKKRHRPIRRVHEDDYSWEDEPVDLDYDECGDGYFNE